MNIITIDSFKKDLSNHLSSFDEEGITSRNSIISKRIQNISKYYHDFNLECEIVRRILQKGIDKVNKTKGDYVMEIDEEDNNFVQLAISDIETPKESKSPIHISKLSVGYSENQTSQNSIFDYNSDITDLEMFKLTTNYQKISEFYDYIDREKISLSEMQKRSEQLKLSEKIIHSLKDDECNLIRCCNNHNYHAERITSFKKLQIEYEKLLEQYQGENKNGIVKEEAKEESKEESKEENKENEEKKEEEENKEENEKNELTVECELELLKMKMKDEKRRINERSIQNMVDCIRSSAKLRSKLLKENDTEICSRILLLIHNYFVLIRDDNEDLPEPTLLIDSCHKIYDAVFETTESYKISQNKTNLEALRLVYPHDLLLEEGKEKKKLLFDAIVNDLKNMRREMSKADIIYQRTYSKHFQSYYSLFEKAAYCCSKSLTNDVNNYNKLELSLNKILLLHKQYNNNISNISILNDTTLNNQTNIILLKEFVDKCDNYYAKEMDKFKPADLKEEEEEEEEEERKAINTSRSHCCCCHSNIIIGIQYFYKFLKTDDEYKATKYFIDTFKAICNTEIVFIKFREIIKILVEEGFSVEFHSCIHKLLSKMKELKVYGKYNNLDTISQNIIEEASSRIVLIIDKNSSLRKNMEECHTQLTSCLNDIRTMTIRLKNYVVEEELFYYEIYCRLEYLSRLLVSHIELCDRKLAKSRRIEEVLQQMYELWWTDSDARIIYRVITTEIPQIEALSYSRPSCSELYLNPSQSPTKYVFGKGIKVAPEPSSDLSLLITGPPLPTPLGYEVFLESLLWSVESYQYYYPNMRLDMYNEEMNELLHTNILVNNKKIKMWETQISIYQKYILSHMHDIDLLINAIINKELILKENNKYLSEIDKNEILYHENTILYDLCGIDCLKLFEQIEFNLDELKKDYKEFIKTSTYHFNKMRRLHNLLVILIKERIKEIKDINENNACIYREICDREDKIEERIKNVLQYKKMNEEKYNELMKCFKEEKVIIENIMNEEKKKIKFNGSCMSKTSKNQMNVLLEKWNNKQEIQMNNSKLPFKDMQ